MDVTGIAQLSTSLADTGTKQAVGISVEKKAQDIQSSSAAALIEALPPVQSTPNLPSHIGSRINTTA
ncbi:MAG TPA: putative motility protein [Janthinobacterium sp.]|nr:putative motility protein [Janthinobacterium sp.]